MSGMKNIAGQKYGLLTAVRPTEERKHGYVVWEWRCDCGNAVFVSVQDIKRRKNPSCGCGVVEPRRMDDEAIERILEERKALFARYLSMRN